MTDSTLPTTGPRTAVITGAASGMGRSTAELLVSHGWTVIGVDVSVVPDIAVGSGTSGTSGNSGSLVPVQADITDRTALDEGVATALRTLQNGRPPHVDLVANIAGVFPPSTLDTYTDSLYRLVFDVNVLGSLNLVAVCRPHLTRGSAVVNFASVDAFTVSPGQLLYGASKAAVVMITKSLALELAPHGIRVNGIAPGWVDTPGNAATGRMAAAAASVPLGRVAQPEEIARWVEIMAGDDAAFLAGETIVLSGADVMR